MSLLTHEKLAERLATCRAHCNELLIENAVAERIIRDLLFRGGWIPYEMPHLVEWLKLHPLGGEKSDEHPL